MKSQTISDEDEREQVKQGRSVFDKPRCLTDNQRYLIQQITRVLEEIVEQCSREPVTIKSLIRLTAFSAWMNKNIVVLVEKQVLS